MDEKVMVIDKTVLADKYHLCNGIITDQVKDRVYEFALTNHRYMVRKDAEISEFHKQIIPYVVVRHRDKYLLFKRKPKQTEARLHNMYSLGVGGHINPSSEICSSTEISSSSEIGSSTEISSSGEIGSSAGTHDDPIIAGMLREFNEELTLAGHTPPQFTGLINDDSNAVGRCHLGFLFTTEASTCQFSLPESDKMEAEWIDEARLHIHYNLMEPWSQLYFDCFVSRN